MRLLSSFELARGEEQIVLAPGLQRVVAFLALNDRPVGRARLSGTLWPNVSDQRATANLRCALWRLRQFDQPILNAIGMNLRIDPRVEIDLHRATARAHRLMGRADDFTPDDLSPSLFMSDLLEDWYDDWVQMERERFRQVRLHALEALCERLVNVGRLAEAVEAGLAAVGGEPFRASAQRALIRAYLAEGNTSEAIRQYRLYEDLLAQNLDVAPSFALADIVG